MKGKEKIGNGNPVFKVDFSNLDRREWKDYTPAILVFDKVIYRLSTWQELLKIFYYLAYKSKNGAEFFDNFIDQKLVVDDNKNIFIEGSVPSLNQRLNVNGKPLFTSKFEKSYKGVKFCKNAYVSCGDTKLSRYLLLDDWVVVLSVIDNLEIIGYVVNCLKLPNVQIYLSSNDNEDETEKAIAEIISNFTKKSRREKCIEKNAKYFLAHINGEILSPEEKFFRRIEKEFDSKILLGDIIISQEEEVYLKNYMTRWLQHLDITGGVLLDHPKVFAVGLVRYAMKYYNKKTFWPYFVNEYGVDVKVFNQSVIHSEFRYVMRKNKKYYDDNTAIKIDNISLHSFVTDRCADQLFNYLFDYWRLELKRNIENIYGDNGKIYFKALLEEIKANNDSPINNVMKHTSMALICNQKSCVFRIRRILEMMDACFWKPSTTIPQTGNRIKYLLQKWMQKPNGKFLKEGRVLDIKHTKRSEALLSSPQLVANFYRNEFSVKLPQEILRHCENDEHPYWVISTDNYPSVTKEPTLLAGAIGNYTDECEVVLSKQLLFCKLTLTLTSESRQYARFVIKQSDIRFFNEKGINVDCSKDYLPTGKYVVYSLTEDMPKVLGGDDIVCDDIGGMYAAQYELNEGDILVFSNSRALPIGNRISEGLVGVEPLSDVTLCGDTSYSVYSKLPRILFKAKREQLAGTAISINEKRFRITDFDYHEFKLDDTLDDVYAYLIDLYNYIEEDGTYLIQINIPHSMANYCYKFAYLKDFSYYFDGAPYIFKDYATIVVNKIDKIKVDDEWDGKSLQFIFDLESKECSNKVDGRDLKLDCVVGNSNYKLCFRIPAFFWKYKKDDDWHNKRPADIALRNLPAHLYVCGPFNYKSKDTYMDINRKTMIDINATDIYAERVKDEDYYDFYLTNLKSWLDYSQTEYSVELTLDRTKHQLFNIICKSKISKANLYGDYDNNVIHGSFAIVGDAEYTVKVKQNGEIIGQDIPLVDGEFELETEMLGGTYEVSVYEIIDDGSGFDDFDSLKIGEYSLKLTDLMSLQDNVICLKEIAYCNKEYKSLSLSNDYFICNLKYAGHYNDVCDWEINGLWRIDLSEPEQFKDCVFYTGTLVHKNGKEFIEDFNVLVIFYDRLNCNKAIILRYLDGEYVEFMYDYKSHLLVYDENDLKLKNWQKKERLQILYDDIYDCVIEMVERGQGE